MHIALHRVERIRMFGEFIFGIAVNIVERVEVGGFPVVCAMNDCVFQIAVVIAFQIVIIQAKLFPSAQGDEGVAHRDGGRGEFNAGDAVNVGSVVKSDIVVVLCVKAEH